MKDFNGQKWHTWGICKTSGFKGIEKGAINGGTWNKSKLGYLA